MKYKKKTKENPIKKHKARIRLFYETVENGVYKCGYKKFTDKEYKELLKQ